MNLNKIVLIGIMVWGIISVGSAQTTKDTHKNSQNKESKTNHKASFEDLNLTKDQEKKVHAIKFKYGKEIKKVEDSSTLTKEQKKISVADLKDKKNAELKLVLSADQYAQLEEIRTVKKQEKKENKEDEFKEALNLTDDQSNQIKRINEKYKPQLKVVKEDTSLTEDVKNVKIKTLQDAKNIEINALLTPTQQKKFKELKGGQK